MKEQRKYLTEEELKGFLKGIESTGTVPFSPFPTAAALRAAEPGQLKLSDWDRKAQRLFVPPRAGFCVRASSVVAGPMERSRLWQRARCDPDKICFICLPSRIEIILFLRLPLMRPNAPSF
jgi:hypothetical protein